MSNQFLAPANNHDWKLTDRERKRTQISRFVPVYWCVCVVCVSVCVWLSRRIEMLSCVVLFCIWAQIFKHTSLLILDRFGGKPYCMRHIHGIGKNRKPSQFRTTVSVRCNTKRTFVASFLCRRAMMAVLFIESFTLES